MTQIATEPSKLEFKIEREFLVSAPIAVVFESVLEQMGPGMTTPNNDSLDMVLEPFPGGRWYRDLGSDAGHLWGHVQSIKPPTLLELTGPLFMSSAVSNNVLYRLAEEGDSTRVRFVHTSFGLIPEEALQGMEGGWTDHMNRILERAERRA